MSKFRIVSFYTDDVVYREEVKNLISSIDKFNLLSYIEKIDNSTSWKETGNGDAIPIVDKYWRTSVNYKPHFIKKCLDQFDENIVWVDADARIRQYPSLFEDIEHDVAIHFRDGKECLTGTVFFKNNQGSRDIINTWISKYNEDPCGSGNQRTLGRVLNTRKFTMLPASYTLIFDLMKDQGPPVIEHFQASRKKRLISGNGR